MTNQIIIKNKKASFLYEFVDKFVAGIVLTGTEIKALRSGKANLVDSYCTFINNELWVKNLNISEYFFGSYNNHEPRRDRKLLMNRKELDKLEKKLKDKGLTVIPTKLFVTDKGYAKLELALARGKKQYDKREDLKQKDAKREMDRLKKPR